MNEPNSSRLRRKKKLKASKVEIPIRNSKGIVLTKTQVAQATAITTIKGREIITVKEARRTRRRITAQTSIHALSVGRSIPENVERVQLAATFVARKDTMQRTATLRIKTGPLSISKGLKDLASMQFMQQ